MSLRTKLRGFTLWVNLRLQGPSPGLVLSNVVSELTRGTNLRDLLESITGCQCQKVDNFDKYDVPFISKLGYEILHLLHLLFLSSFHRLSRVQMVTRGEWTVDELRRCRLVTDRVARSLDSRMFASRDSNQVIFLLYYEYCINNIEIYG